MKKKEIILKKAKLMFAENGFEATTMDKLALVADVNKATIYYYFKDKKNLYSEAFRDSVDSIYKSLSSKLDSTQDAKAALKLYINAFYQHAKDDETFIRMLTREIASSGKHFPNNVMDIFIKIVSLLNNILDNGYKEGVFLKNDAKVVHFLIIGAISFFILSAPIRENLKNREMDVPDFLITDGDINENLYKIILKGLEKV